MLPGNSPLYQDLHRDHRDAMYRAMAFIAGQGGPPPPGDAKEILVAHRERAREWLLAQADPVDLNARYERFRIGWSPVFAD